MERPLLTRPLLLDLFCCAGGCAKGYADAGFEVVGVDIEPKPSYPYRMVVADAMRPPFDMASFDAIHASPPCQGYSKNMRHLAKPKPMLIEACREMLRASGRPWIIENVEGAPLESETTLFGEHGVLLCGTQFGLRIRRHRLFETSFSVPMPPPCNHRAAPLNPHREESRERMRKEFGRVDLEAIWRKEAGVAWMNKHDGRQAIPPVFTEYIGKQLLAAILTGQVASRQ